MALVQSEDVNTLVWRYLMESNFEHTAWSFKHESGLNANSNKAAEKSNLPTGALVSLIQKGLMYIETEVNFDGEARSTDHQVDLSFEELMKNDVEELKRIAKGRRTGEKNHSGNNEMQVEKRAHSHSTGEKQANSTPPPPPKQGEKGRQATPSSKANGKDEEANSVGSTKIHGVQTLNGHTEGVYFCSFSPESGDRLATASGDGTARIWTTNGEAECTILQHNTASAKEDITCLAWSPDGQRVATAKQSGSVYIWNVSTGKIAHKLEPQQGPVIVLCWSPSKGDLLFSGGQTGTIVAWDASSGRMTYEINMHEASVYDIQAKDNIVFASGGGDGIAAVFNANSGKRMRAFKNHVGDVNRVAWDSSGALLASAGDDNKVNIWSSESTSPRATFYHSLQVYDICWHPRDRNILASASWDSTVKVFNVAEKACMHTFTRHSSAVFCVSFSNDGQLIASGGYDSFVYVWDSADGSVSKSFQGKGGVFKVSWSIADAKQVAASFEDTSVAVIDVD